jgi:uncharacterized phage protein (TIGR01671 family)
MQQRQIKFRAWDTRNSRFVFDPDIYSSQQYHKRFTLEQFTGLLDKNGKEIYEGDVLADAKSIYRPQVVFEDGRFAFAFTYENGHDVAPCQEWYITNNQLEVIGNIHENPELLESGANSSNK